MEENFESDIDFFSDAESTSSASAVSTDPFNVEAGAKFETQCQEYLAWHRSDPDKRVWPTWVTSAKNTTNAKSTFRKRARQYELDTTRRFLFKTITKAGSPSK